MKQPELLTDRLILRELTQTDAPQIQKMAADKRVSDMTANIPYPYPDGAAAEWIGEHANDWLEQKKLTLGIQAQDSGLIGAISLEFNETDSAELAYWLGVDYWGQGFATEAVKGMVDYGLRQQKLKTINARILSRNPASGRVLLKSGFEKTDSSEGSCGAKFERIDYFEIRQ